MWQGNYLSPQVSGGTAALPGIRPLHLEGLPPQKISNSRKMQVLACKPTPVLCHAAPHPEAESCDGEQWTNIPLPPGSTARPSPPPPTPSLTCTPTTDLGQQKQVNTNDMALGTGCTTWHPAFLEHPRPLFATKAGLSKDYYTFERWCLGCKNRKQRFGRPLCYAAVPMCVFFAASLIVSAVLFGLLHRHPLRYFRHGLRPCLNADGLLRSPPAMTQRGRTGAVPEPRPGPLGSCPGDGKAP